MHFTFAEAGKGEKISGKDAALSERRNDPGGDRSVVSLTHQLTFFSFGRYLRSRLRQLGKIVFLLLLQHGKSKHLYH
jgi:hypothetical protein